MCGRFSQSFSLAELLERFHIDSNEQIDWMLKYNVPPMSEVPVVVQLSDGRLRVMTMKWGLLPPWAKTLKERPLFNLRADTLLGKTSFKHILDASRCIVPVDGFYEWGQQDDPVKPKKKIKIPYRFVMNSGEILGLAGLYGVFARSDGKKLFTVTLITTEANDLVGQIHDRMPVIIPRSQEAIWLSPTSKPSDVAALLSPYPADPMRSYEVSTKINSGRIDSPDLILPRPSGHL